MEITAESKNNRISTRKARVVAKTLSGRAALGSLEALKYEPKKAAFSISKVLKSAIANATNNFKIDEKDLIIREVVVNEGQNLKRYRPRSRGMAHPIIKKSSHIKVILVDLKKESKNGTKS